MASLLVALLPGPAAGNAGMLQSPTVQGEPTWTQVAPSPLPAVHSATVSWDGQAFMVLGGDEQVAYGPAIDQDYYLPPRYSAAAATFDPGAGTWKRIADLPVPPGFDPDVVVAGDRTYVLTRRVEPGTSRVLLAYDPKRDVWDRSPIPPGSAPRLVGGPRLAAVDAVGSRHAVLEAVRWTVLTRDPFEAGTGRQGVWVESRLVVSAVDDVGDGNRPPYVHLAGLAEPGRKGETWKKIADTRMSALENRPLLMGDSLLVWAENERVRTEPPVRVGGTFDLRCERAARIPKTVGRGASYLPSGMRLTDGVTLNGGLFDPLARRWADLPAAPGPPRLYPAHGAGSRFVLSFGGAPAGGLPTLTNGKVPRNVAYVLTLTSSTDAAAESKPCASTAGTSR